MKFTRFVGQQNRNPLYKAALRNPSVRKMDLSPATGNITVDFTLDGTPMALGMSPVVRDLIDLAAIMYTADELRSRNSAQDRWTRDFQTIMPVRAPGVWKRVDSKLQALLCFLAGDRYQFEWARTSSVPALRNHRTTVPEGFDVVCLFSGGADSLAGSYELLKADKSVLLVGHQADGITASTQDRVFQFLQKRFGERVAFIQARVARSPRTDPEFKLGRKVELTHRCRSFLFLSLAVAVAAAAEIDEIVIPENGLIALNPPLNISRIGTLSTRTAHPRFISNYVAFVRALNAFRGRIHNPFLYLSKTDVIKRAPAEIKRLLRQSLSCSHLGRTRWAGSSKHHCGYCIPCLYRRAAFAAVGLDDPSDYYRDVFRQFNSLSPNERSDVRALTSFAQRVKSMTVAQRAAAALSQGACNPADLRTIGPAVDDPYATWSTMLNRWAVEFVTFAQASSSREIRRKLGV